MQPATAGHARLVLSKTVPFFCTTLYIIFALLFALAICLYPLWPPILRKGVHHLSIAWAGFLVFVIVLGIVKYMIFALLFALSGGKLKFWILPNLTEDVGFLESFKPLYDYT